MVIPALTCAFVCICPWRQGCCSHFTPRHPKTPQPVGRTRGGAVHARMAEIGLHLADAFYMNGVFAAVYRGGTATEDGPRTWTHVEARPTCYIGRKILEDCGMPKSFSMKVGRNQNREECKALACAWVDRMHFLSQHLSLARRTHGPFFETHYDEREDLMQLFDMGPPPYRNRVRRMWQCEPKIENEKPCSTPSTPSSDSTLAMDMDGTIVVT